MGGCGRWWEVVAGRGRWWEVVGDGGRLWEVNVVRDDRRETSDQRVEKRGAGAAHAVTVTYVLVDKPEALLILRRHLQRRVHDVEGVYEEERRAGVVRGYDAEAVIGEELLLVSCAVERARRRVAAPQIDVPIATDVDCARGRHFESLRPIIVGVVIVAQPVLVSAPDGRVPWRRHPGIPLASEICPVAAFSH